MFIKSIEIENFRLLRSAKLTLDTKLTLLVGKNNSGKTSCLEILQKFLGNEGNNRQFLFEDFSEEAQSEIKHFCDLLNVLGKDLFKDYLEELDEKFPKISLTLELEYQEDEISGLNGFIVSLNPSSSTIKLYFEVSINVQKFMKIFDFKSSKDGEKVSLNSEDQEDSVITNFEIHKNNIYSCLERKVYVVDVDNLENRIRKEFKDIFNIIKLDFISAQRYFSENRKRLGAPQNIGRIIQDIYRIRSRKDFEDEGVRSIISALEEVEKTLNSRGLFVLTDFKKILSEYGQPGQNELELDSRFHLDPDRILEDFTETSYVDRSSGLHLPEHYSGLGTRNLCRILLEKTKLELECDCLSPKPLLHLICIEEPEAHLHPQLQEVFIKKIQEESSTTQFVITTHSSHILNSVTLNFVRYCRIIPKTGSSKRKTVFVDFKDIDATIGLYITLTKCDLLFADKAVLFEGSAERILLPYFIRLTCPSLLNQYVTYLEIGGNYAEKFCELLNKLGIKCLILTDLDPVYRVGSEREKSCISSVPGAFTKNTTIINWFKGADHSIATLIGKDEKEKIKANIYLSYQIPSFKSFEVGTTLEDDLILSNKSLFRDELLSGEKTLNKWLTNDKIKNSICKRYDGESIGDQGRALARIKSGSFKKVEFALKVLEKGSSLEVPEYITLGLKWLSKNE